HIPRSIAIHLRTVQANSSPGSHYQESALSEAHVAAARIALLEFLDWYAANACGILGGVQGWQLSLSSQGRCSVLGPVPGRGVHRGGGRPSDRFMWLRR